MARITCADCGRVLVEDDAEYRYAGGNVYRTEDDEPFYQREDDEFICGHCFDEHYFQCEDCDAICSRDEAHYGGGVDRTVCSSCDNDYETCECCEERYPLGDMRETQGGYVCECCYIREYYTCDGCCCVIHMDDARHSDNGGDYCGSCYDERFTTCCECGEELAISDSHETPDGLVCSECLDQLGYIYCDRCGVNVPPENIYTAGNGDHICETCLRRSARDAGRSVTELLEEYTQRREAERREAIERLRRTEPPHTILGYHHNTERCFLSLDGETTHTYFGIELEVECTGSRNRDTLAEDVLRNLNKSLDGEETRNHWTAMHDGSLSRGFELISQPMTARYFDKEVAPLLKTGFKNMIHMGLRSHDTRTCGLHFHVSRTELSTDTLVNMKIAVDKFKNTVVKISRRKNFDEIDRWAHIEAIRGAFDVQDKDLWDERYNREKGRLNSGGRYLSLNFTNSDTVEFRICKGTLKYESFIGCLHFFRFLIDWCASHTFQQILEEIDEQQFRADMAAYSSELRAYAIDRKVIIAETLGNGGEDVDLLAA